jgi:cystatin-A/B
MFGAPGEAKNADDNVKKLAKDMKPQVEKALGETYGEFDAVKYTTQVVAGTNYKIKVKVGDGKYVHMKVYVPLPCKNAPNELKECEKGKTLDDAL